MTEISSNNVDRSDNFPEELEALREIIEKHNDMFIDEVDPSDLD